MLLSVQARKILLLEFYQPGCSDLYSFSSPLSSFILLLIAEIYDSWGDLLAMQYREPDFDKAATAPSSAPALENAGSTLPESWLDRLLSPLGRGQRIRPGYGLAVGEAVPASNSPFLKSGVRYLAAAHPKIVRVGCGLRSKARYRGKTGPATGTSRSGTASFK